jgi:PST family polysaccharide transporter
MSQFWEGIAELPNSESGQDSSNPPTSKITLERVEAVNRSWVRFMPGFLQARMSGRNNLQAILGNSAWLFTDKALRMGVGLIVGVWVARYLGPGRFGLLNYAIAFTSLFGALATFGTDSIVVRELVKSPEKRNELLGSAFILKLIGSSAAFGVVMIAIRFMRRGDPLTLWVVALSAAGFIFQSVNVIDLFFQSQVQSRYTVYATNSAFLLIACVRVALILTSASLIAFAWAALAEIALASAFLLVAYWSQHMNVWAWRVKWHVMRDLLSASWPLMLSGISVMIAMRVDQVLIGQIQNDRQVGIYSAATRLAEIWYFIPIGIAGSAFPLLVESKKLDEHLYYERLQKLYNVLALLSITFALAMTFLSVPMVELLYGSKYASSAGVLSILIWSGVPVSIGCAWTNWMLLENRTRTMFLFQVAGAAFNLILNLALIPRFGIIGSAWATLISYWLWIVVLCAIMKSQHRALTMIAKAVFPFWIFARSDSGRISL